MTNSWGDKEEIRRILVRKRAELVALDAASEADRETVALDQQSVGRLSRMDAMQRQAMAKAQARRREQEIARINAALARLDAGEYGECLECGEAIAPKRLGLDPAAALCIACAAK
ncbi:MAG: TraR/DksA C4-type zinc finger protein [Parvularculaceae bacterium]